MEPLDSELENDPSSVDNLASGVLALNLVEDPHINQNTKEIVQAQKRQKKNAPNKLVALVYMDLSKDVVKEFATTPTSNEVDNDEKFQSKIEKFLGNPNKKRILYTPNLCVDDIGNQLENNITSDETNEIGSVVADDRIPDTLPRLTNRGSLSTNVALFLMEKNIMAINSRSVATKVNEHMKSLLISHPKNDLACRRHAYVIEYINNEYNLKFTFLKSLDPSTPEFMGHPDAIKYRSNFDECKKHLANAIYDILNHTMFNCAMKVGIVWNKSFTKVSHCSNTTKGGNRRNSVIELSNVLIKSAHSLMVALAHEMCHAAAWLYSGEIGHGQVCKAWLLHVGINLPEIPQIEHYCGRPAHLYAYSCLLCEAKSQGSIKLEQNQDNVRCFHCYGPIKQDIYARQYNPLTYFINKKNLSEFALFIKNNYRSMMSSSSYTKHSQIMHALNEQYNNLQ